MSGESVITNAAGSLPAKSAVVSALICASCDAKDAFSSRFPYARTVTTARRPQSGQSHVAHALVCSIAHSRNFHKNRHLGLEQPRSGDIASGLRI
jgi:hypothetical protein